MTGVRFVGTDEQGSYDKTAEYVYDDRGFRLKKKDPDGKETWYIRDAGGNVLATYEKLPEEDELEIKETMIYGSGRIGIACPDNFSSGYRHDFVKLDPDKGYISGDEYRNEYEGKDYELLPAASMTLTQGFVFDAAGTNTFEISTVDASEILGASQYELTDHLGNVRVAVVNETTSVTFSTHLETAEEGGFENVSETRHQDVNLNHTPGGSYSSWLNSIAEGGKALGPSITLMVSPGDKVKMSAYGMYREETGGNTGVINTLISALAGSFTGTPGLESGAITSVFDQLPAALTGAGIQGTGNAPKAYLKYIVFDKNFKPFDAGNITTADTDSKVLGSGALNSWEKLEMEVSITKNGYIYIYTANESTADVNVHFDDIEVTLIESPATSGNDYYPFGLAMEGRSWSSEPYRFGYQGQFSEFDDETGWNAFELRMYDPTIARWLSTDPEREFASPYVGMGNNPINAIDPDGGKIKVGIGSGSDVATLRAGGDPYTREPQFNSFTQALININEFNPLAVAVNAISGFFTGEDINGRTHTPEDALISINEWNPLANAVNGISALTTGYDINGREMSGLQPGFLILGAMGAKPVTGFINKGIGYLGAGYFYAGYRTLGSRFYTLHPRLYTFGPNSLRHGHGQFDAAHRATTFMRKEILHSGSIGVRNYKTIFFNYSTGGQNYSIGVNPWTRTIFHEGPGIFK